MTRAFGACLAWDNAIQSTEYPNPVQAPAAPTARSHFKLGLNWAFSEQTVSGAPAYLSQTLSPTKLLPPISRFGYTPNVSANGAIHFKPGATPQEKHFPTKTTR
jgi:hypothetical protein